MHLLGDIGGTKTRLIFCQSVKDLKKSRNLKIYQTPQNYKEFLNLFKSFLEEHSYFLKKMRKIVFGFAGMFDKKKEKLIYAPNLKDFENRNLKKDLEKILFDYHFNKAQTIVDNDVRISSRECSQMFATKNNNVRNSSRPSSHKFATNPSSKIILENDAFLAGIGEANFGAGKKFTNFGYLTLSTGIGGAKIFVSLGSSPEATQPLFAARLARCASLALASASAQTFTYSLPESRSPNLRKSRRNEQKETNNTNLACRNCEHLQKSLQEFATNNNVRISSRDGSQQFATKENLCISSRESSQEFATNVNIFGSEPGHSFLLINDFLFEAEELLGGESIKKFFGKKPEEIKDKKFWNYYHQILSIFLINVSIFWSVDKIILGGGITKSLDFKKLNFLINKLHPLPVKIKIIKAKLGEMAVLYGGLAVINGE